MASSFSDLGIELMATGENAGTWGDKTNTNLQIVEKSIAGYVEKAITSGGTTALTITDGDATESTSVARHAVIKLTGTITGNSIVTVPDSIEKVYIVTNGTSGAYTVQFKTASGTGITFGVSEKTTKLVYSDGTNIVDAGFSGGTDLDGKELILDADADTSITADTDDQIDIKIAGADDFQFTANTFTAQSGSTIAAQALTATTIVASSTVQGTTITATTAFVPDASDGAALGTSSLEFSDLFLADSSTIQFGNDQDTTLTHTDGTGLTLNSTNKLCFNDTGTFINSNADGDLDLSSDGTAKDSIKLTSAGAITLDANNTGATGSISIDSAYGEVALMKAGSTHATFFRLSDGLRIRTAQSDADLTFVGVDGGSDVTALTLDMSAAGKATFNSDVVVGGDLTVSGDDIVMATNTAGNLLIADGTNFNSVAVGSLSEISTVANDDVFLAVDTSGGGLKKIARSAIVSGLATSGAISNVVEDTSPQLGGNLDMNGADIVTTSNADLELAPNGTGHVTVRGNTNSGAIQFNCESNSHGQILKSQPHSAAVTNVMLLPDGADSTLVSLVATQTLTNKTLTTPVIAEIDSGSTITLDATTDIVLDADGGDIFLKDAGTTFGEFTNSSTDFVIKSTTSDKDIIFKGNDGGSAITALTLDMSDAGTAVFNHDIKIPDDGKIGSASAASAMTIESSGQVNFVGDINVADDIFMSSDSAQFTFGANSEIRLQHVHNAGLQILHTATGDDSTVNLTLATDEADIQANDTIGILNFQAPSEGTGTDSRLVAASIAAVSEGDFAADNNATKLSFRTAVSEAASEKMSLSSAGLLTIADDLVIKDGGTIGSSSDTDAIAIGSDGDVTLTQDLELQHDGAILSFGANDEVTLTHVHNDGLLLNSDNQLQFRDSAINIRSDADGDLDINADDEVEINSTLIDVNGNVEISGTLAQAGIATFAVAANVTQTALTSSSNAVAWDASAKPNAVHVTTENTTFSAPSNAVEGAFICLEINYNGSHTIAFNTVFEFAASTAPTTTDTDGKTDILVFRYNGSVWQEVGRTLNLSES
jgi:hypothetical protein